MASFERSPWVISTRLVVVAAMAAATAAGCGAQGSGGREAGAGASLSQPFTVALAPDGTLFIADTGNARIRRVSPDGLSTTVAGDGLKGYRGDNGPATAAELNGPAGLAIAPDGSLYIADELNHRIRRVNADGVISTVAGDGQGGFSGDNGPAISAQLSYPIGVTVAPDGGLLIADTGNDRVREVSSEGIITTVAGDNQIGYSGDNRPAPTVKLNDPTDVALAADGRYYIADQSNNRVREVAADGIITTVAGDGLIGNAGDLGPAAAGELNVPTGVALAPDGSIYIADQENHRVQKVSPDGIVTTVAGNGQPGFGGDAGPATAAKLHSPTGLALGRDGSLYIADELNDRVRRVSPTGIISTVVGGIGPLR